MWCVLYIRSNVRSVCMLYIVYAITQAAAVLSPPSVVTKRVFREINYLTIHILHGILFYFVTREGGDNTAAAWNR